MLLMALCGRDELGRMSWGGGDPGEPGVGMLPLEDGEQAHMVGGTVLATLVERGHARAAARKAHSLGSRGGTVP